MKYFSNKNFPKTSLKENKASADSNLTLGGLKERLDSMLESGVDPKTPIAIEHLEDDLFLNKSWKVMDYLWQSGWYREDDGSPADEYSTCVTAFQSFLTKDINDDPLIIITPHY